MKISGVELPEPTPREPIKWVGNVKIVRGSEDYGTEIMGNCSSSVQAKQLVADLIEAIRIVEEETK